MPVDTYRIKIQRGAEQFEAEGDKTFVLEMLARFETSQGGERAPTHAQLQEGEVDATSGLAAARATSPGEFVRQFGFKQHTDLVLAFGYYLEKHSGLNAFTPADINNCYYEAKMENSNTSQMIIRNIQQGYMMEAKAAGKEAKGARTQYRLTNTGEEYLRNALAGGSDQ